MKPFYLILAFLLGYFNMANAQELQQQDTIYRVALSNVDKYSTRVWANDTLQYHYNQMKYYVKTILPYLNEAVLLFNEIDQKLNREQLSGRARKRFIKDKENIVKHRFEDKIASLNETQGVLLIKLIARQTGLNLYQQLSDFKGTFPAIKWQAWARFHGFNLNRKYQPNEEHDLEQIMRSLGYPLPAFYGGVGDGY